MNLRLIGLVAGIVVATYAVAITAYSAFNDAPVRYEPQAVAEPAATVTAGPSSTPAPEPTSTPAPAVRAASANPTSAPVVQQQVVVAATQAPPPISMPQTVIVVQPTSPPQVQQQAAQPTSPPQPAATPIPASTPVPAPTAIPQCVSTTVAAPGGAQCDGDGFILTYDVPFSDLNAAAGRQTKCQNEAALYRLSGYDPPPCDWQGWFHVEIRVKRPGAGTYVSVHKLWIFNERFVAIYFPPDYSPLPAGSYTVEIYTAPSVDLGRGVWAFGSLTLSASGVVTVR